MQKILGFGGSTLSAAIAASWWLYDKPSFMNHGWIVVVAMGTAFTGLVAVSRPQC